MKPIARVRRVASGAYTGIALGRRDGFEAMMRMVRRHKPKPVVVRMLPFPALKESIPYPNRGAHFAKIVIRH